MAKILAIESSCDETACAIVEDGHVILSNVVSTQIDTHKQFGGVVPEVASRLHVEKISVVIKEALEKAGMSVEEVDAIAYTKGPGLIGSLHVGVQAAKTLAWVYQKPMLPMNHMAGHIYANAFVQKLKFPLLALVISGGHSQLIWMKEDYSFEIIGDTLDDAVGEAYDKVSRILGTGYPGGPIIDQLAKQGKTHYFLKTPKTEVCILSPAYRLMAQISLLVKPFTNPLELSKSEACTQVKSILTISALRKIGSTISI